MRKQYDYYVNGTKVERQTMIGQLKACCRRVTEQIHIGCGLYADITEFDEKKFNKEMRSINNGAIVMFADSGKTFRRKESK